MPAPTGRPMVDGMLLRFALRWFFGCFACVGMAAALADEPTAALPERVSVPDMRTSIYVGSVTLEGLELTRMGETWSGRYEARVFPWAFWNEHGDFSLRIAESDLARLLAGERIEFTGDARNQKGKPREVTGRATPSGDREGEIKVRIRVDGIELVFNGTYTLTDPQ